MVFFSIIIPVFNIENMFFKKCIDSIEKQTFKDFEVIIVDDGSDKDKLLYYKKTINNDKRIKIFSQKNQGVSDARNKGIHYANANYLIFIDADDWVENKLLEKLHSVIMKNNKCDIVCFDLVRKNNTFSKVEKVLNRNEILLIIQQMLDECNWLNTKSKIISFGSVWNKCFRKDYVIEHKIEFFKNVKYSEDVLFSIQALCKAKKIIYTNYNLYNYRIYGYSTYDKYNINANIDMILFIESLRILLQNLGLFNLFYKAYLLKVYTCYQFVMTLKFFHKQDNSIDNKKQWVDFTKNEFIQEMLHNIDKKILNLKGKIIVAFANINFYNGVKLIYKLKGTIRR